MFLKVEYCRCRAITIVTLEILWQWNIKKPQWFFFLFCKVLLLKYLQLLPLKGGFMQSSETVNTRKWFRKRWLYHALWKHQMFPLCLLIDVELAKDRGKNHLGKLCITSIRRSCFKLLTLACVFVFLCLCIQTKLQLRGLRSLFVPPLNHADWLLLVLLPQISSSPCLISPPRLET